MNYCTKGRTNVQARRENLQTKNAVVAVGQVLRRMGPLPKNRTNAHVFEKGQDRVTALWVYDIAIDISQRNNYVRQGDSLAITSSEANCLVIVTIPPNGALFAVAFSPTI